MANFGGVSLDNDVKENTGAFTVFPAGKYKACLIDDDLADNKAGTGKLWKIKLQFLDGQFVGETLVDNINITNANPKAQAIGQGTLRRICGLCGVPYPPQDTAGMMGKPLGIDIKVEKFVSNTTGKELESNKVRSYGPVPEKPSPVAAATQPAASSGW